MNTFDLNDKPFSEQELSEQSTLNLKLEGEHCISMPMPQRELYVEFVGASRLIIDAPNVSYLGGKKFDLRDISYLPSLRDCSLKILRTLSPLLTPEMQEEVNDGEKDYNFWKYHEGGMWRRDPEWWGEVRNSMLEIYIRCYHELARQGMLLPPRISRAKSARSVSC